MQLEAHWSEIFTQRPPKELGWYEDTPETTLNFLSDIDLKDKSIFLPGAGTTKLIPALLKMASQLYANDISTQAISRLAQSYPELIHKPHKLIQANLGVSREIIEQIDSDVSFDLWIDRAVLHFLTTAPEVTSYLKTLNHLLKPKGYVMLAEFTHGGAKKCANLPIQAYSTQDYQSLLGSNFQLIKEMPHTFINPRGEPRLYQYALFQKRS